MEREENIRPRVENLDGWCRQAHVQLLEGQIVRVRKSQKESEKSERICLERAQRFGETQRALNDATQSGLLSSKHTKPILGCRNS